ncbi:MAG: hypothetical protein A3C55_00630 [Gammaproteobacteria bacterium RIFCSPHIGHO2_02_FULL_42_13]|nr:MAG: hypothetical protein A3C55_00630 [Gammaproteobacteria bacterium RIFCSPHIGHO2_02_FULL_42_13]OGT69837.1 MAG: hypothetical protein A3H43_01160 [Gammaproteobacteria bacterium RIFCSPLOWO2_02_FULL_42_9]
MASHGYFYFLVRFRLRGKAARTATQGERLPAPLEHPQAKSPTRQAAGKSLRIIPIIWRE